jgi:hypothetical protein
MVFRVLSQLYNQLIYQFTKELEEILYVFSKGAYVIRYRLGLL